MNHKILIAGVLAGATLTAAAAPALAVAGIPKGFLLYEKAAAKKDDNPETNWEVDRRTTVRLIANPCGKADLGTAGRTAARTVIFTSVPDFQKSEQVILYSSAAAAAKAMADLRQAVTACPSVKSPGSAYRFSATGAALGDEGLALTGQIYQGRKAGIGGERAIVARRGSALLVYAQAGEWGKPAKADFTQQTKDAKKMIAKVCTVATCG